MNSNDILDMVGDAKGTYVWDAQQVRTGETSTKVRKFPAKKMWLIAAIVALTLLLVGCAVVYVLSLQNLKLGEQQEVYDIFSDDGSAYLGQETVTEQVLTLAGIKGTPGYQAALEWFEFKQNYDSDGAILASVWSNTPEFPAEYSRYGLYSQEMKDKVDEILGKYRLKPAGAILEFRTLKNMCAALGVERIQTASNDVSVLVESGECHENGNFSMMVDFTLPDSADAEITSTWGLLRWNRTDCFSDDMIALESVDDWQEWNYTTVSGSEVLIIRSDSDARGWIICDRGEAVLSLQLEARQDLYSDAGVEYRYLTDDQMEQIADAIDFGIQPRIATQYDVDNQPAASNASTQNGYTVELKSVETDGWVAYITMSITAPEGTIISHNPLEGFEDANYNIGPTNRQFLFPTEGNSTGGSGAWGSQEDNDGLDNTQDIVLKATRDMDDGSAPFGLGKVWTIRFEDLQASYWDREKNTNITQILVEGEWEFEITFDEENGDYREVELLQQPTVIDVVGLREPESPIWDGVNVTSFILRKFGATITFDAYYADFSEKDGQRMYVVMNDGSRILLYSHYGDCTPERTIDLDEVDHVLMVDGTKLMMPETQIADTTRNYPTDDWAAAKTKFESILTGKDSFYNQVQAEDMTISQFCESFMEAAEVDFKITQYALSDLDQDGIPELILWENINGVDDCGFLVICYDGTGGAVGYEFSYRGMIDLKKDGTFGYSGGVTNTGYATLEFHDNGWEYDIFGCVEEQTDEVSFRWGDTLVSQDEYWEHAQLQTAKEPVQWIPYPADHYDLSYNDLS